MNNQIAEIILDQLGRRLKATIGAKDFLNLGNGLGFKYPRGKYVAITLNGKDLYDLQFKSIHGVNIKDLNSYTDVYAEDLKRTFEKETGLYLSL